ncbi:MAG TPA: iron-containing redox enzyme family protein [Moraxellaceae bacterium]
MDALTPQTEMNQPETLHRALARWNGERLAAGLPVSSWEAALAAEMEYRLAEGRFLDDARARTEPWLGDVPEKPREFLDWFEQLRQTGPGQQHDFFDWIAEECRDEEMRWFLRQEVAGEAGFEDLVAYTQVKLPAAAKLEMARNYWDEMGRGKPKAMHGPLLGRMVHELALEPSVDNTIWEALALANTMVGLALNRPFAFQSLGALGAIELTAPDRARKVVEGMRRLGYSPHVRSYFDLHAVIDLHHSEAWNRNVLRPLLEEDPYRNIAIAEGAIMRLQCGEACFERYCSELCPVWAREAAPASETPA